MANSVVEICNNALQDLGEDAIMALTDDSKAARLCNQRWPAVRDAVLRAHPWNCTMRQAELASGVEAPIWKWGFMYNLPVDFLRLVEVVGPSGEAIENWEIQGRTIFCDAEAPLFISYVARVTDPKMYDSLLAETLSARLAATLAYPISASTTQAEAYWNMYRQKLAEARGVDAREGVPESIAPKSWMIAKMGG